MRLFAASWMLPALLVAGQEQAQFALEQQTIYAAANSTTGNCDKACVSLQQTLGQSIVYHGTPPEEFLQSFYSAQQQKQQPVCIVTPETAQQIASAITIVRDEECPFAVRSGGHGAYAGASNIHGGLTFDLRNLNSIELSEDKTIASVGAGRTSIDIYTALTEHKLSAALGRVGGAGAGGFLLGGGFSLYSQKYGWAVDGVRNFEIVLSDGTIANANVDMNPDLYWALRGGGGNFGIVTRFDVETHPLDLVWGGTQVIAFSDLSERQAALNLQEPVFDWTLHGAKLAAGRALHKTLCFIGKCSHSMEIINHFVGMAYQPDENAHMYIWVAWSNDIHMMGTGGSHAYLEPVKNPTAFENMTALKKFYDTTKLRTMPDLIDELTAYAPGDYRTIWNSTTFKVDAELISQFWDIFIEEIHEIKNIPSCQPAANFQLIKKNMIVESQKNGGNPMGLKPEDGPLFLFSITVTWPDPKDDATIADVVQRVMSRAQALGEEKGLYHPFVYKNYVDGSVDAYAGYGENRQKLREIQKKYDSAGIFPRLMSDRHKV